MRYKSESSTHFAELASSSEEYTSQNVQKQLLPRTCTCGDEWVRGVQWSCETCGLGGAGAFDGAASGRQLAGHDDWLALCQALMSCVMLSQHQALRHASLHIAACLSSNSKIPQPLPFSCCPSIPHALRCRISDIDDAASSDACHLWMSMNSLGKRNKRLLKT